MRDTLKGMIAAEKAYEVALQGLHRQRHSDEVTKPLERLLEIVKTPPAGSYGSDLNALVFDSLWKPFDLHFRLEGIVFTLPDSPHMEKLSLCELAAHFLTSCVPTSDSRTHGDDRIERSLVCLAYADSLLSLAALLSERRFYEPMTCTQLIKCSLQECAANTLSLLTGEAILQRVITACALIPPAIRGAAALVFAISFFASAYKDIQRFQDRLLVTNVELQCLTYSGTERACGMERNIFVQVTALLQAAKRKLVTRTGPVAPDQVGGLFEPSLQPLAQLVLKVLQADQPDINRAAERLFVDLKMNQLRATKVFLSQEQTTLDGRKRVMLFETMRQAVVVYQLRAIMASCPAIGVVGTVRTGKSTLLKKAFPSDAAHLIAGAGKQNKTVLPTVVRVGGRGALFVDFPGQDEGVLIRRVADDCLAFVAAFVCVFDEKLGQEQVGPISQLVTRGLPTLVCLNHVDALLDQFQNEGGNDEGDALLRRLNAELRRHFATLRACELRDVMAHGSNVTVWLTSFNPRPRLDFDLSRIDPPIRTVTDVKLWCVVQLRGATAALIAARRSIVETLTCAGHKRALANAAQWVDAHVGEGGRIEAANIWEGGLVEVAALELSQGMEAGTMFDRLGELLLGRGGMGRHVRECYGAYRQHALGDGAISAAPMEALLIADVVAAVAELFCISVHVLSAPVPGGGGLVVRPMSGADVQSGSSLGCRKFPSALLLRESRSSGGTQLRPVFPRALAKFVATLPNGKVVDLRDIDHLPAGAAVAVRVFDTLPSWQWTSPHVDAAHALRVEVEESLPRQRHRPQNGRRRSAPVQSTSLRASSAVASTRPASLPCGSRPQAPPFPSRRGKLSACAAGRQTCPRRWWRCPGWRVAAGRTRRWLRLRLSCGCATRLATPPTPPRTGGRGCRRRCLAPMEETQSKFVCVEAMSRLTSCG